MARRGGHPSNAREVRRVIFVGDPIAESQAEAVFVMRGLDLAGHSGVIRAGMTTGATNWGARFAGELGALQNFRGAVGFGATASGVRPGFNRALPSTAGPVVNNNRVLDVLRSAHM